MPESPLIQKEITALANLEQSIATRARGETETELAFLRRKEKEEQDYRTADQRLRAQSASEIAALEAEYKKVRDGIVGRFQREKQVVENEYAQAKQKLESQARSDRSKARKAQEEARWQALAVYEAARDSTVKGRKEDEDALAAARADFEDIEAAAILILERYRKLSGAEPVTAAQEAASNGQSEDGRDLTLQDAVKRADLELLALEKLKLPAFLLLQNFIWPFIILGLVLVIPLGLYFGWVGGGIASFVIAVGAGVGGFIGLRKLAVPRVSRHYHPLRQSLADSERLLKQTKDWIKTEFDRRQREVEQKRESDVREADEIFAGRLAEIEGRYQKELREADQHYPTRLAELRQRQDDDLEQADSHYPPRLSSLKDQFDRELARLQESNRIARETTKQLHQQAWDNLVKTWSDGLSHVADVVKQVREESARRFLDWSRTDADTWSPPTEVPPALPFGAFSIDLSQFPDGVPHDPRLAAVEPNRFDLPALLPFPIQASTLIKTAEAGKGEAVKLLQALMLRFLTSVPPGKVRFTIIDPVGLGENFAAFMHLADYSELLVSSRIWTETPHIEQRLADLSAHMENVIQKYLRNEFETIEQYNTFAGEVAEPFRVLVVANFPTNFNEQAARRLMSIVSSGARCGVYALISLDTKLGLPPGCQLKDLESSCINLNWKEGRLQWRDPHFGRFPLVLDSPPDPSTFTRLLHVVGEKARDANRVEVPFEFIAPTPDQYWTGDSRSGVDVPLGRAGATKLQHLALGKGTSQHVLIAGKTGSGKSTLLHALITNAALRYSPDELELYLIDFKKGVEFKVYATLELPHAKVIAVESEREFGLSVLQRLDAELKHRGDRFRDLGVQDLKGYRDACPESPMPRILLIVDEFQEFFVEDDKIAQEVSLLLDRLVRQGRAFGIHINLGSQTLSGAYSLARSTLGQMAVRIALQCSEADAHLILSEDNTAARLLTRPGEAIYNDANGMLEGNNLFQVVWLADERRESYLRTIQELARAQNRPPASPIVFEGNLPAVASKNPLLNRLLDATSWLEPPRADQAWLGDAIAIKDPTCAVFRPQSGSNLLIIGQNDEAALAMLLMTGLSIAAQHPPRETGGVRFYLFDGCPVDSSLAGKLGQLDRWIPHPVKNVAWRELAGTIGEIAAEVDRRQGSDAEEQAPIYLMIHDLQRFRDLRKQDDDFGFSSSFGEEKPASPSKQFSNILREGPAVGVHTIVWCDSLNNLNRTFDRQGLREFEIRVLFQMSANDSSTLIDSPAAGKLGPNRALYFSEEENRIEKFRPYGLPDPTWLERVADRFQSRPRPTPVPPPAPALDGVADVHQDGKPPMPQSAGEEVEPAPEIL